MSNDPNDFLMGGGITSAKFDNIGDTVAGVITNVEVRQQTTLEGDPMVWDNGDPRMQLVVTLQTDVRDDEDDDGKRNVYVKGTKAAGSKSLHDAVRAAVEAAGAKGIENGGKLTVSYVGAEPAKTKGHSDRKLYTAAYVTPDKAAQSGEFLGTTPATTPATVTPPASTPPAKTPAATAKELLGLGVDVAIVAQQTGLDVSVVEALKAG